MPKPKAKPNPFFQILYDIKVSKTGKYLTSEEHMKVFNNYSILRTLSKDDTLARYVDYINNIQHVFDGDLTSKHLYKLLIKFLPVSKKRPAAKAKKAESLPTKLLNEYCETFQISSRDVQMIYELYGKDHLQKKINKTKGIDF